MEDLALHMLDIMENSIRASARRLRIRVVEETIRDVLSIEIEDDGKGMDATTRQRALDPFFTTKTTRRVGLGIPLLAQAARESEGSFEIASTPGKGTTIRATFRRSHPDRKALGDIPETIRTILQRLGLLLRHLRREAQRCRRNHDRRYQG
jgi:signal transduction histidine kinase